jgi:hypothetical protein
MTRILLLLALAGCAAPARRSFTASATTPQKTTTAQKASQRTMILENREPPLVEPRSGPKPGPEPMTPGEPEPRP